MKLHLLNEESTHFDIQSNDWSKALSKAQDKSHIHFSNENDEGVDDPQKLKIKTGPYNTEFICQLRSACGDWEQATYYFRCQKVVDGEYFCFIPNKDDGNHHLIKDKQKFVPPDSNNESDVVPNEADCWAALKKWLLKYGSH